MNAQKKIKSMLGSIILFITKFIYNEQGNSWICHGVRS